MKGLWVCAICTEIFIAYFCSTMCYKLKFCFTNFALKEWISSFRGFATIKDYETSFSEAGKHFYSSFIFLLLQKEHDHPQKIADVAAGLEINNNISQYSNCKLRIFEQGMHVA